MVCYGGAMTLIQGLVNLRFVIFCFPVCSGAACRAGLLMRGVKVEGSNEQPVISRALRLQRFYELVF